RARDGRASWLVRGGRPTGPLVGHVVVAPLDRAFVTRLETRSPPRVSSRALTDLGNPMADTSTTGTPHASVTAIPRLSRRTGFWAVAFSFWVVTAFSTAPSSLYGLYERSYRLSSLTGALATFFTAGYAGLSVPVIGVGLLLQHLSPRVTLLIFGVAVGV